MAGCTVINVGATAGGYCNVNAKAWQQSQPPPKKHFLRLELRAACGQYVGISSLDVPLPFPPRAYVRARYSGT